MDPLARLGKRLYTLAIKGPCRLAPGSLGSREERGARDRRQRTGIRLGCVRSLALERQQRLAVCRSRSLLSTPCDLLLPLRYQIQHQVPLAKSRSHQLLFFSSSYPTSPSLPLSITPYPFPRLLLDARLALPRWLGKPQRGLQNDT